MTYFDDPQHAAEAADEERTDRIAAYLDQRGSKVVFDDFLTVLDDAMFAEDRAKLHGQYPPAGHGYPREEYL
ncbi:hypothetical protein AB0I84_30350 [Streptomyces spectabilis]|uniref:hypothetical protein n=1 Tax=Streptomyces spectabilis TaxID=68270 RepID=UPI0033E84BDE